MWALWRSSVVRGRFRNIAGERQAHQLQSLEFFMSKAAAILTTRQNATTIHEIHEIDRRSSADLPYDRFLKE